MIDFKNAFSSINQIPVKTWRWLKVNDTNLEMNVEKITDYNIDPTENKKIDGITISKIEEGINIISELSVNINTSDNVKSFVDSNHNSGYFINIKPNKKIKTPLVFDYVLNRENKILMDSTYIIAQENSEATIIFKYESEDDVKAFNSSFLKIHLGENAKLNIFKIQLLGKHSTNVDFIGANCESGSNLQTTIIDLGANETIGNADIHLIGKNSNSNLNTIYFGKNDGKLDYNYRTSFQAKMTTGSIVSDGVLMDKSKKTYRGTIDLYSGSTGSVGSEEEHTILLSKDVKNVSVPLLLTGEYDVEANHATSTGNLDDNALFYMMSRGISEKLAKKMMVEAAFTPIIEKIPEEILYKNEKHSLKDEVFKFVRRHLDNA